LNSKSKYNRAGSAHFLEIPTLRLSYSSLLRLSLLWEKHFMGDKLVSTEKVKALTEEDVKFLFNELRKASIIWDGRKEVLKLARKKVFVRRAKNGNPVFKYQWQCAICKKWTKNVQEMEVDHITEIGGITEYRGDWNEVIGRIFARPVEKHFQALCIPCHLKKTKLYTSALHKFKRKTREL
jgi:hypothetical protein